MAARLIAAVALCVLAGCGAQRDRSIVSVPIGAGAAYRPPSLSDAVRSARPVGGSACGIGVSRPYGVHLELFAAGRAVVVPAGIGIAPPRRRNGAYVDAGRCAYPLRTREPTGVIEVGRRASLGHFFALWGQPLSRSRLASFGGRVSATVDGAEWRGDPRAIPLRRHAQIVLQVGPRIPPHPSYRFPPGL